MYVLRGASRPLPWPTVLTIGNFDGVHRGHHALLARLREVAAQAGGDEAQRLRSAVLTFEPHPREYFTPQTTPARLSSLREKLELIAADAVEVTCVCRFNAAFAALSAEEFISRILVRALRVKHLIVGDDFRFGADRRGDFALLERAGADAGFTVEALPEVTVGGARVSSSAVRLALAEGDLEGASRLLGRPYVLCGRVVRGASLGRQLGFPTANIHMKHERSPFAGVFVVEVTGLEEGGHPLPLPGVANLGYRPSLDRKTTRPVLEVHLFDFDRAIYGAHLNVRLLHKLRDEMKFPDLAALKAQIARDVEDARRYFRV
ncbi:MAG: bifunctional riboflavin kinase/FAD synthetase [Betaproteobacteria bacterium]|nr:bifunctional riboflavin kinase/FAD synthetase [Betaproteobacteria bacterium]